MLFSDGTLQSSVTNCQCFIGSYVLWCLSFKSKLVVSLFLRFFLGGGWGGSYGYITGFHLRCFIVVFTV